MATSKYWNRFAMTGKVSDYLEYKYADENHKRAEDIEERPKNEAYTANKNKLRSEGECRNSFT